MPEPTLSEDKALELMEQCLVQGLKEWAVVTDLRARVTALEQDIKQMAVDEYELVKRIAQLEQDAEQMYHESKGNGP